MSSLLVNREDRVLRLTLNRPDKRNALSADLCRELVARIEEAERDPQIGCILLDAAGPIFCAGMDLDEALAPNAPDQTAIHEPLFTIGSRLRIPLVAAVQGPALGGGVGLVANAHIAVAAQGASFGLTEIRLAMWPFLIHRALTAAIGERRTLALSLTGRIFSAQEALQWGLIHEIAPAIELDDRATDIAVRLSQASPEAIRRGLHFVHLSRTLDWPSAGKLGAEFRSEAFASADFKEGVQAFREKRQPKWPSLG